MAKDLKPHIGIFGKRNSGKSSLINALTNQDVAIVSDIAGTTTDPVKKSVEIFGTGPAIIIDTAGIDDNQGELGQQRIKKSLDTIATIDLAIVVFAKNRFDKHEEELIKKFRALNIPYIIAHNKSDNEALSPQLSKILENKYGKIIVDVSASTKSNIDMLVKVMVAKFPDSTYIKPSLFDGILKKNQTVVLVTPIDSEAPEGRMILPQVMAIRDALDHDTVCVVLRETQLENFIKNNKNIDLVVTDSQAFGFVSKIVPESIPLTGFSVLFSRIKAHWEAILQGTEQISKLKDGDNIIMLESCTHHVSCEDIGRYKLPKWISEYSGKKLNFHAISGLQDFEDKLNNCALVIQCGGCVATQKQVKNRLQLAIDRNIAVSNYGMAIAYVNGIFPRVTKIFK
jgi:[FeFe] hydrogenase H-cluster maturation GTPase HydF